MSFFKPEDFHPLSRIHGGIYQTMGEFEGIAHLANKLLQERGIKVFGDSKNWNEYKVEKNRSYSGDTHQALLVCIEELPKKECKHEPSGEIVKANRHLIVDCIHCSAPLKAKWEEVK